MTFEQSTRRTVFSDLSSLAHNTVMNTKCNVRYNKRSWTEQFKHGSKKRSTPQSDVKTCLGLQSFERQFLASSFLPFIFSPSLCGNVHHLSSISDFHQYTWPLPRHRWSRQSSTALSFCPKSKSLIKLVRYFVPCALWHVNKNIRYHNQSSRRNFVKSGVCSFTGGRHDVRSVKSLLKMETKLRRW
jgi:hypothetical protein